MKTNLAPSVNPPNEDNLRLSPANPIEYRISALESRLLRDLVLTLHKDDLNSPNSFTKLGQQWAPLVAPTLASRINDLKKMKKEALFLTGLPRFSSSDVADNCLKTQKLALILAAMLGQPFQFKQQNHGEIVAKVTPEAGFESTNSSSGRVQFGWHTDDSFLHEPFRPEYITLAGYINTDHVRTNMSSIDDIAKKLPTVVLHDLMKPKFSLRLPTSFRLSSQATLHNIPLIWFDGRRRLSVALSAYNASTTNPDDHEGRAAIQSLLEMADNSAVNVDLQAGTMLLFRNNKYLHSRNIIKGERVVFRTYVRENLTELRMVEGKETFVFDLQKIVDSTLKGSR